MHRPLKAELLAGSRIGRSTVVRPNDRNPATGPLRQLLVVTYGPAAYLADDVRADHGRCQKIVEIAKRVIGEMPPF